MTIQQILKLYGISFLNKISKDGTKSIYFYGGGEMEMYFTFLRDSKTINEEIIPVVDHYIDNNPFPIDNNISVGGGNFVDVTASGVNFIDVETHEIVQTIPLYEFKLILQFWAEKNR